MKKFFALLIVMALCIPMFALADINPEGLPISTEPITLTAVGRQTPIQGDLNEMVILKQFAEDSNVTIQFQNIPESDISTQLSLLLASGEVPDVLFKMAVSGTDQAKYAEEGMFVALSDYPELTPNLNRWFEEYPTAKDAVTKADGKVYAGPYILAGDAIRMGIKIWFNTDVMEKIGWEAAPTTTEELHQFLLDCKALDYNENGQADEIALTSSDVGNLESTLAGSFGLYNRGSSHSNVYVDDDGVMQYAWNSERYRKLLSYLHDLYADGLIDPDIFTMDFAQLIAKASTGRALNYIFVNNSPVSNTVYEQYTLGFKEPFEGPDGYKYYGVYSLPASTDGNYLVTYKCAEKGEDAVKAAIRWMDYWYSDEGIIKYFMGVEGVTYEKDENAPGGLALTDYVMKNPDGISFEEVLAKYVPWAGGANPSVATNEYFKGGETWPVCLEACEGLINYVPETIWTPFTSFFTAEEASDYSSIGTDLTNYRKEWRAYFITGEKSLETDWDEYVAGYDGYNLDRYMEIYENGRVAAGVQ